jgi:hypothetical protein
MPAFAAILMIGCAGSPAWQSMRISSTRGLAQHNNTQLMKVEIGQTKEELVTIMGQAEKREAYQLGEGRVVEFLFYRTAGWSSREDRDRDDQFTPVAVEDGKVRGWGRNYYENVVRAAVEITIK